MACAENTAACGGCTKALIIEEGYSNYTVEGSEVYCMLGLHPNFSFDNWYRKSPENGFAKQCASYSQGDNIIIDVEKEILADLTAEQKEQLECFKVVCLLMNKPYPLPS